MIESRGRGCEKNKTLCNKCGKEFNSKGALTKHMKTHQSDLPVVDASIPRENFKDRVLKFSNSNTLEETAEKFNLTCVTASRENLRL